MCSKSGWYIPSVGELSKKGVDVLMEISIRKEQEKDYRRVEEITRAAFAYPERIERGGIGCPYEHWMVNELWKRDGILEF